jgi:hypothetical protein
LPSPKNDISGVRRVKLGWPAAEDRIGRDASTVVPEVSRIPTARDAALSITSARIRTLRRCFGWSVPMTKSKADVGMPMHMYVAPSDIGCDDP